MPTKAFVADLDLAIEFRELCFVEGSISRYALLKGVFLCLEFGQQVYSIYSSFHFDTLFVLQFSIICFLLWDPSQLISLKTLVLKLL